MKKHKFYIIILSLLFALLFNNCKKYSEGGFVRQTCKNLFGGSKTGNSKTWKLKYYEVNGIDSTHAIQGANTVPDFYDKFITFTFVKAEPSPEFVASTFLYKYAGTIDKIYKKLNVGVGHEKLTKADSTQCEQIGNTTYCSRNILFPEVDNYGKQWNIKKLTRNEIIIEINLKNFYKITLSQ